MPVKIVTLVQLFLFAVSLGLFVMAALTFTRRRQAPQSGLLVLAMCAEAFYCFGYAQEMAQTTLAGAIFWLHGVERIERMVGTRRLELLTSTVSKCDSQADRATRSDLDG